MTSMLLLVAHVCCVTGPGEELLHIGQLSDRLQRALSSRTFPDLDHSLDDATWLQKVREDDERLRYDVISRFMITFAEQRIGTPESLCALVYVVRHNGIDPESESWRATQAALILAGEHMLHHPDLPVFTHFLARSATTDAEALLRRVATESRLRHVRATAKLHLAHFLQLTRDRWKFYTDLFDKKPPLTDVERFWKLTMMPYLERQGRPDDDDLVREIDSLLTSLVDEGAGIPCHSYDFHGPGRVLWKVADTQQTTTIAEQAGRFHVWLKNIVPGKPAPEIEGADSFGNTFKLSDYRGKVVLLTFSANWCPSCAKMYPTQRALIQQFRDKPFVILSVSRDEELDTLKHSIDIGDISWRCWWDGSEGPIAASWRVEGAPHYFLIDHTGVLHSRLYSNRDDFAQAIAPLVEQATECPQR